MEHFSFDATTKRVLEKSCIPYAVYCFVNDRITALVISDGFCDLFETDRETALDQLNNHTFDRDHPDDVARLADEALAFATEGGEFDITYRTLLSGGYKIVHARGKHVYAPTGDRIATVWYSDEGMYEGENKEIYDRAMKNYDIATGREAKGNYDSMTGLPGMNYFFKLAESARDKILEEGADPVLLYFDFSDMKNYNLKYGFSEGDKLITGMARVLASHFSNINCCRFGGDHFAVVTDDRGLEEKLEAIIEESKGINEGKSLPLRIGIYKDSMGYATAGVACDRAKMACDMKRDTPSSVINYFSEDMLKSMQIRHYILDNLDIAIREKWIQVYYQPIIRSANGLVCDEEALARWIDPVMGLMSPGEFIPILEETKQIYKMDLYVLDQILEKMKMLEEHELQVVPCSLNVSRSDFEMCDIVGEIRKRVDEAGIGHELLTIEITESDIGSDLDYIKRQAELLSEMGFSVWMDDYGSGYSSPDILQNVSFNTIKLDMQFMRQFDKTPKSRIIISEIINMALNLGLETVVEGVETMEQVEFLREVGATKLQGFYFCKPIEFEEILRRHREGALIGFEKTAECEYYSTIGRVNMYDISLAYGSGSDRDFYRNTIPMAIFEADDDEIYLIRSNKPCKAVLRNSYGDKGKGDGRSIKLRDDVFGNDFVREIIRCGQNGYQTIEDKQTKDGKIIHMLFRRLAINPVTGKRAVAVVMLEIRDVKKDVNALTYKSVATALSSDYLYLYYVNTDTEDFVEYRHSAGKEEMAAERRGKNFFESSRRDAFYLLHKDDREGFINTFEKDIVLESIRKYGSFTYTYRLLTDEGPVYVNMKATAIGNDGNHIIIGVNNVDAQMRQKEAIEKLKEEKFVYARISALAGDYIAFYTVDPIDDSYFQYNATNEYDSLGVSKSGKDFFSAAKAESEKALFPEDVELFRKAFDKDNILKAIDENGMFAFNYRLMIGGKPKFVRLKAGSIVENGKRQLIFGINDVDAQVKLEQEYAYNLAAARNKVNLDALTGVKNKNAYNESEESLNKAIKEYPDVRFAIAVFDINDLKLTNDKYGHSAGDELIRQGCKMICHIFAHSPVFRIGGDEFVCIAKDSDYENIDSLMEQFYKENLVNMEDNKVVVAGGMSRFSGDSFVEDVFKRADAAMYENKRALKKQD